MNNKKLIYIGLSYISQGLNILLNLLLMKFLSPTQLGSISLAKIYFQAAEYMHLGSRFSLDRFLPTSGLSYGVKLLNSAMLAYFVVGFIYVIVSAVYVEDKFLIISFSLSGFLFTFANFIKIYHRAKSNYNALNKTVFFVIISPIIVQVLSLSYGGYNGFVIGFGLGYLFSFLAILIFNREIIFHATFNLKTAVFFYKAKLAKPGFMLFISNLLSFFAMTVDRVIVGGFFSLELLGYYSIVLFFISICLILPSIMSELALPEIIQSAKSLNINKVLIKYFIINVIFSVLTFIIVYFLFDFVMQLIEPKYIFLKYDVIFSLLILIPYVFIPYLNHYFNAIDKQFFLMKTNMIAFFIYLSMLFIYAKNTINIQMTDLIAMKVFYFFIQASVLLFFYLSCKRRFANER